jgi:two-component system, chemotaxis family, protein-glutamate methylesterase/glutaminase
MAHPITVLVVDDSTYIRQVLISYLSTDPEIRVVGSARDGLEALAAVAQLQPDVVTLDVEMPRMDGLTALQSIMADSPRPVIMLSSLTQAGASTTIRALMRGAVDFVAKPTANTKAAVVFGELAAKIKDAAQSRLRRGVAGTPARPPRPIAAPAPASSAPRREKTAPTPLSRSDRILVIGASTGGPRALGEVVAALPADLAAAVVIVQHMPAGFTHSLAQRLNEDSALTVREAISGDHLKRGLALVAPGDWHLTLERGGRVALNQGPRRNQVRPSVDVAMESAAQVYSQQVVGVVLTGMGSDGRDGAREIKAAGGRMVAEDETTAVVYGMPRSVVDAGLADRVAPLGEIAGIIGEMVRQ